MAMFVLGMVILLLTAPGVAALNSTSWAYCRVYPDPHFTTVRYETLWIEKNYNVTFVS